MIVPTGTANTASVVAAFRRLGVEPEDAETPEQVTAAARVVVPGVGAFGAAMGAVDALGMREALRDRIDRGRPTLAVCVGMQLLAAASVESPGTAGLGLVAATVERFPEGVPVPQLGWNRVEPAPGSAYLSPGWAYFAHSFRLTSVPDGWVAATAEHGGTFLAALERGAVLALQFHPELSGSWGSEVLARWMEAATATPRAPGVTLPNIERLTGSVPVTRSKLAGGGRDGTNIERLTGSGPFNRSTFADGKDGKAVES